MAKDIVAMVLVGGRGTRLGPITKHTAKPAVSYGGKYKLIDFVLSNLSNAFIDTIGIITQYEPHELMQYIQRGSSWDLDVAQGGIHFLTPYTTYQGDAWQKGTAHAIYQHRHFIQQYDTKYVLILSGDHVYKMDYQPFINAHKESNADITISAFNPNDDLSRYGIINIDKYGKVIEFQEKPKHPKSNLASMGIYVFKTSALLKILSEGIETGFDFGNDIIPKALKEGYEIKCYQFKGYFRDVGTPESLFQANMDLLDNPELLNLSDYKNLPIFTRSKDLIPLRHQNGLVKHSLIGDGTIIQGDIFHSVIASNVYIKKGAILEDVVIFDNVVIGEDSHIRHAIILDNTVILPHTIINSEHLSVIDNETLWTLGENEDE